MKDIKVSVFNYKTKLKNKKNKFKISNINFKNMNKSMRESFLILQ